MGSESEQTHWFRNDSVGHQGAVKFNAEGRLEAVSVPPGGTVELSEEEMRRTAAAPQDPNNNPLVAGGPNNGPAFVEIDQGVERPIYPPAPPAEPVVEETAGDQPDETAAAPEGSRDAREEVGVPPAG